MHFTSFRAAVTFALCLGLGGCATSLSNSPRFSPAPPPPEGFATVYIYRFTAPPYLQDIKLSVAGKPIQPLPEKGYTLVNVRAGTHTIVAEWPKAIGGGGPWKDVNITRTFEPGKAYFFRLYGEVGSVPGGLTTRSAIIVREKPEGEAELIACCSYLASAQGQID
jgi:hypothetical protein